jgi:hypothetical protein
MPREINFMPEERDHEEMVLKETSPMDGAETDSDIDWPLLKDNLAKTPWERMQANDDALNFAESLRTAMKERCAKPK